ncbi:MAG TPA: helix-turn-helix transcriptional regulator [Nocardioides sp.]
MTVTPLPVPPRQATVPSGLPGGITLRLSELLGRHNADGCLPAVLTLLEPYCQDTPAGPDVDTWMPASLVLRIYRVLPAWPSGLAHAVLEAAQPWMPIPGKATLRAADPGARRASSSTPPAAAPPAAPASSVEPTVLAAESSAAGLSPREREVLLGMANGLTNGDIGRSLYLSEDTIKTHARRMFAKLEAKDRAQAVARGYQLGILTIPDEETA